MRILDQIYDKLHRNINIYLAAYKAGKIAGFDYTILRWKNHTKFLLRIHKQEDHRKELKRMTIFWDSFLDVIQPYINAPIYPSVIDDGKEAEVCFLHYIRPEQKFASIEDLQAQMERDVMTSRQFNG